MNTHDAAPAATDLIDGKSWQQVKGELISLFGTISEAARKLKCHPNTLRDAVEGRAPGVRARLVTLITATRPQGAPAVAA